MNNNKIIFFTIFACAAIMSSLFIFHYSQKPPRAILSADTGIVFPAARDIKPFELVSENREKFNLHNLYGHWTLVFFGFTHCSNICPTTLATISKAYDQLLAVDPKLKVVLISVDPERDTPESLKAYIKNFNADFVGLTGKINEIRQLQSQLGIYSERDTGADYQVNHTPSILLINPQGKWAGVINYGLTPAQVAQAFKNSVRSLG